MQNAYDVLGVAEAASDREVKAAYLTQIKRFTPNKAPERFQLIQQAYAAVKTAEKRAEYALIGVPDISLHSVVDAYVNGHAKTRQKHEIRPSVKTMCKVLKDSF